MAEKERLQREHRQGIQAALRQDRPRVRQRANVIKNVTDLTVKKNATRGRYLAVEMRRHLRVGREVNQDDCEKFNDDAKGSEEFRHPNFSGRLNSHQPKQKPGASIGRTFAVEGMIEARRQNR